MPTPDTVRKAKKLFEETLLFRSMKNGDRRIISINDDCKDQNKKYLQIDTSYNGGGVVGGDGGMRKWDSASLSSGVSSGDLSSPCDCNDGDDNKMLSNGDDLCESYYVSQVSQGKYGRWLPFIKQKDNILIFLEKSENACFETISFDSFLFL